VERRDRRKKKRKRTTRKTQSREELPARAESFKDTKGRQ
jgi:hypothetical protein